MTPVMQQVISVEDRIWRGAGFPAATLDEVEAASNELVTLSRRPGLSEDEEDRISDTLASLARIGASLRLSSPQSTVHASGQKLQGSELAVA